MKKILHYTMYIGTLLYFSMVFTFFSTTVRADDNEIKIASIFAKTGTASASNFQLIQAVRFAVEEINANGGLLGKKLKILEYDNCSTPIQSNQAARKAVKDGVVAAIGASWSDHSLAMAPVFQKAGIPMISPDSTNPKLTRVGDFIFRACFSDTFQGQVLAKFATEEFHANTAVLLVKIVSSYSIGLAETFSKEFTRLGGKVLAEETYKDGQKDFSAMFAKIKELQPDVLFIPGHDECGFIVKQAQNRGIKAVLLGGDGWGYNQFYANGGQELKQAYYTSHWSKDLDTPESKRFVQQYQKQFELDESAGSGYEAVMLLADAIRRAGSTDRKAIRDALAATKSFKGVSGTFSIDAQGDPIKPVMVIKVEEGKSRFYKAITP